MHAKNTNEIKMINCRSCNEAMSDNLAETHYCDYSHPDIQALSRDISQNTRDTHDLIEKAFLFVRDTIAFGGDHWQVKASETLSKGFGACFNKNLLMISILRALEIPCKLMANPMKKSFTKPSVGSAYLFFSNPFYHCFTHVLIDGHWKSIDPTLDRVNYKVFFKPAGVTWTIDWDGQTDMLLYSESVAGASREMYPIDDALNKNLDSHFLFRHEPKFVRGIWLSIGNKKMWRKTRRFSVLEKASAGEMVTERWIKTV